MNIVRHMIFEDRENGFTYHFMPVDDTLIIEERETEYVVYYLTKDADYHDYDLNTKEMFLVNYHHDCYIEYEDVISKDQVKAYYQGEKIPQEKDYHIFYMSCLVHSGVWLSLSHHFECDAGGWDTSHVGLVMVSKKATRTRKKATKLALEFLKKWNAYLHGEIFCLVKERFTKKKRYIVHDTVCGFVGFEYARKVLLEEREQYLPHRRNGGNHYRGIS